MPACTVWYQVSDASQCRSDCIQGKLDSILPPFHMVSGGRFKRDVSCELVSDVVSGNPIQYKAFIGVFQAMAQANLVSCFC